MIGFPSVSETPVRGGCTVVANDFILCVEESSDGDGFMYELGRISLSDDGSIGIAYDDGGQVTGVEQDDTGLSLAIGGVLEQDDIDMAVVMCGETCCLEQGIDDIAEELGFGGTGELAAAIRHAGEVATAIDMLRHAARLASPVGCVTAVVGKVAAAQAAEGLRALGASAVIECHAYDHAEGRPMVRLEARCDAAIIPAAIRLLRDAGAGDDAMWISPVVPAATLL